MIYSGRSLFVAAVVPWADDIKAGSAISLIDRIPSPPLATGRVL